MAIGGTKCLLVGSPKINQPLRHRTEDNMCTLIPTTAVTLLLHQGMAIRSLCRTTTNLVIRR